MAKLNQSEKYNISVEEGQIIVTGVIPVTHFSDLSFFFESILGEGCVMSKHPENQTGFAVHRVDMATKDTTDK